MAGDYQLHTATPIRYRENLGVTSACSARGHTHAITGQMFAPTPYDCTTPPWLVQTSPFPNFPVQQTSTNTSPASPLADPRLPRPAPREHCLQDDLFYAFTRDAYLSSETTAASQVARNLQLYYPPQQNTHRTLPLPRVTKQEPNNNHNNKLQFTNPFTPLTPLTPSTSNPFKMEVTSRPLPSLLPHSGPMASKPVSSAAPWSFPNLKKKRRRRASQIFNMNFSFGFASRRKSQDRSPEVSPRTSISSASGSPRSDMEESRKRQRVDSRATDAEALFASEKNSTLADSEKTLTVLAPSTRCDTTGEMHPGQLVDFTSTPVPTVPEPIVAPAPAPAPTHSSPASEFELRLSSDAYHDYLATTQRRRSFPAGEWAARRVREEFQMLHKLEKLETKAKTSATTSSNIIAPAPVANASNGPCELHRTPSDPSTEAFLKHVRASLDARKKENKMSERGRSYSIFEDEVEKGFLDDAPL
ncbi:hypothetical protein BKA58DRAFT_312559 [Alternaria rosae]|uniref:uncharacterized protein n=1 Tax=Alternaria rosae TaxID=1187941 RepID=UPI001E8CDE11|nr:uncharacterized protein BKA58DRAFT_312559 [Alternaria rosae]KAH6873015.1 hypothetical protein BKA58DRAFT_312559 [Alternaria rosae]